METGTAKAKVKTFTLLWISIKCQRTGRHLYSVIVKHHGGVVKKGPNENKLTLKRSFPFPLHGLLIGDCGEVAA